MFAKIPLLLAALGLLLGSGNAFDNHFRPAAIGGRHAIQLKATPRFVGAANTSESFALLEARRSLSLFSRQEQECDPGYFMCTDDDKCCEDGENCVADGCCEGSQVQCGSDGCYDPDTEICCNETSTYCDDGFVCVGNGNCCESGQEICGTDGCYDPDTEVCCEENSHTCDVGYTCVNNGTYCCLEGQEPCGAANCYDPDTEICCPGGTCPMGNSCCTYVCCKSFATCGSDGYCTATSTPSVSISTPSTSPASNSATTTSTGCTTPTLSTSQATTQTIPFAYNPSRSIVAKAGPSAGQSIPASNAAVLENMCNGIYALTKQISQTVTLTYGGKCFKTQNRPKMCPGGFCSSGVSAYVQSFYSTGIPSWATAAITAAGNMWCDEFPFANSLEGGNLSHGTRICVPAEDQTWQGGVMGNYFRGPTPLISPGEKYVVEIVGWSCSTQAPASITKRISDFSKRDAFSASGVNMTGPEMWHSFDLSNPTLNLMPMPLGDLVAGSYTANMTITGNLTNITLFDYLGYTYNTTLNADGSISFILSAETDAVGFGGTTYDNNVGVVYSASQLATAIPSTPATTTVSPTKKSDGIDLIITWWLLAAMHATILMAVTL